MRKAENNEKKEGGKGEKGRRMLKEKRDMYGENAVGRAIGTKKILKLLVT